MEIRRQKYGFSNKFCIFADFSKVRFYACQNKEILPA